MKRVLKNSTLSSSKNKIYEGDYMTDTNIKNLSIGWVVKIVKDEYHFTPGYNHVRKIIYTDYGDFGIDILNQDSNKLPINYPVIDFKDESRYPSLENGEYVIMPFTTIGTYLSAFGIQDESHLNYFRKKKIKNLVFDNSIVVMEPLFLRKNINLEKYNQEKEKLSDYKIYHLSTMIGESENLYLKKRK